MSQDQPDGIEDDSTDLPDPLKAADRVNAFLSAYGDGLIVAEWLPEYLPPGGQPPLYVRDLAALADAYNQGLVLTAHIGWELAEVTSQRDQARGIAAHLEGELAQIPVNFAHVLADAQYEIRELKSRLARVTTYTRDPADEKSEGGSVSQDSTNTPTPVSRESLGRDVCDIALQWSSEHDDRPGARATWDTATPEIRELYMRVGESLFGFGLEHATMLAGDTEFEYGRQYPGGQVDVFGSRAVAIHSVRPNAVLVRRSVGPWEATT